MALKNLQAIVLAAGKSLRFNTGRTKLLEHLCGQEVISYPIKAINELSIPITIVVGYQKEEIQKTISDLPISQTPDFVQQHEQHGAGHALACTRHTWQADNILIVSGDMPFVTPELIARLYEKHCASDAAATLITAHNPDPQLSGYNRIVQENDTLTVVHSNEAQKNNFSNHCCIDSGIYIVKKEVLHATISLLSEYHDETALCYNDVLRQIQRSGYTIATISAPFDHIRGINTLQELWVAQQVKRAELIQSWMQRGVHFPFPQTVHLDLQVTIGTGSIIGAGVHVRGATTIGENCTIGDFSSIACSTIADNATIKSHCILKDTIVGHHANVGPFAHLHAGTKVAHNSTIGNFVEMKKSSVDAGTTIKHLSYIGDAIIGERVNIGAGTITCDHDGATKNSTVIKNDAYVGSNTTLVAPVTIGKKACTAAGSVITDDVADNAFASARSNQTTKENYAHKILQQTANKKKQAHFTVAGAHKTVLDPDAPLSDTSQ